MTGRLSRLDGGVTNNPVQPRLDCLDLGPALQGDPRLKKSLLERVFRAPARR
jgi:hypothetical protein